MTTSIQKFIEQEVLFGADLAFGKKVFWAMISIFSLAGSIYVFGIIVLVLSGLLYFTIYIIFGLLIA